MQGRLLAPALCLTGAFACVRVEAGTDPEPLGYGPGSEAKLASGYEDDPNPRPAPTPWTPPPRGDEAGYVFAEPAASGPETSEPVPYNDDIVRVCEQLASLPAAAKPWDADACHARYRVERVFRPIADWKTLAACIEAGEALEAVAACEQATPRVFGPIAEYPAESAACMHIFAITIVGQLGPEPMLDRQRLLEFNPLLRDCVDSFVNEERQGRTPAEYGEMLACIGAARTTAAAEACE